MHLINVQGEVSSNPSVVSCASPSSSLLALALDAALHIVQTEDDENGERTPPLSMQLGAR